MKKLLSLLLSVVFVITALCAIPFNAFASDYYNPSVIDTNTEKVKNYIYKNGYINGNGNYSIEEIDFGNDYYGLYHIAIADSGDLEFHAAWYETESDDLFANTNFILSNFPGTIVYDEYNIWINGNDTSDVTAHCYIDSFFII